MMKRLVLPLLVLVALGAGLTGCGQKGPLYQPGQEQHDHNKDRSKDRFGL